MDQAIIVVHGSLPTGGVFGRILDIDGKEISRQVSSDITWLITDLKSRVSDDCDIREYEQSRYFNNTPEEYQLKHEQTLIQVGI